jgi:hypothetical protein
MFFKPSRRPDLMPSLAGCYRGDGPLSGVAMAITPEGVLAAQGQVLKIVVTKDKIGISFSPDRRITYDPAFPSKLVIDSSGPLLLRISADRRSVTIPGDLPEMVFRKAACSGTTRPSNLRP